MSTARLAQVRVRSTLKTMVRYEPPYVVHMIERGSSVELSENGVVYSSGNPDEAQAFAQGLFDTGAAVVEVRDSLGRLVRRFAATTPLS